LDCLAGNHECTSTDMMNRLGMFPQWVNPRFEYLKDKEIVFGYHLPIDDLAFKIGIALVNEWRLDTRGGHGRETKGIELVDLSSGGVPTAHCLFRQLHRWDVDHTFLSRLQNIERIIPVADHATYDRWLKINHGVPRHGHDICPAFDGGCNHHDWPWFEQAVNFGQGKGFFRHSGIPHLDGFQ